VKFDRLRVPAFGALQRIDTGDGLPGLVVVHGPNESGKSTFFEAVTTVLYGFSPASRDTHRLAPWSGEDAEIDARIHTDDGLSVSVNRRLLKSPTGRTLIGDEEKSIRNRPIDGVEGIPRTLYERVYALTLEELAALDAESWDQLQERLLSRMGARDIVAARSVAEVLEDEAGSLWRDNRRGNQRVRELRERIHETMQRRREAAENDRTIRRLDLAFDGREGTRVVVDRATVLLPLKRRLNRLEELRSIATDGPELGILPADAAGRLDGIDDELDKLREQRQKLEDQRTEPERTVERFSPALRTTLGLRREVSDTISAAREAERLLLENAGLEKELNDLDRKVANAAREVFDGLLDETAARALEELPTGELRSRVETWQRVRAQAEALERGRDAPEIAAGSEAVVGAALGVLGTAAVLMGGSVPVGALGGSLLAIGLILVGRWLLHRRSGSPDSAPAQPLEVSPDRARAAVQELLVGLPVRDREYDREFVSQIGRLKELHETRDSRRRLLGENTARIDEATRAITELGRRLGLELPSHLGTAAGGLEQHRTDAERAEEASRAAERELGRIDDGRGRTEDLMDDLEREREELLGLLARFGDGDADAGLEAVAQRQRARDDAERLRLELEREHPDLRDKIERIRRAEEEAENWLTDDAELAAARASLDELGRGIEQMGRTEESLNQRLSHLEERITTDQIDGELEALDAELQEAMRERDRRIVLAEVVRRADRQFRERNDPDVLGRAAQHLSALTHGRYTEIEASEADVSGPLSVEDPDTGRRVGVDHLSTGTREQVYFSLRLAICSGASGRFMCSATLPCRSKTPSSLAQAGKAPAG